MLATVDINKYYIFTGLRFSVIHLKQNNGTIEDNVNTGVLKDIVDIRDVLNCDVLDTEKTDEMEQIFDETLNLSQ